MFKLIRNELYKAIHLKKIYMCMLIIMIIEISTVMQYKLRGSEYIFITPNGQSLPLTLLAGLPQLMIVFMAVFLADIIADEYRNGTFKISLLRPVDRIELLNAKIISLMVFVATMLVFAIVSSYIVGTITFGWGEETVYNEVSYSTLNGVYLTLQSALLSLVPYLGFGMIIVFVALVSGNIGVTIGTALGIMIVSPFIDHAAQLRDYSIVYQIYSFHQNFIIDLVWKNVFFAATIIAVYIAVFYICSALVLKKKDILL